MTVSGLYIYYTKLLIIILECTSIHKYIYILHSNYIYIYYCEIVCCYSSRNLIHLVFTLFPDCIICLVLDLILCLFIMVPMHTKFTANVAGKWSW